MKIADIRITPLMMPLEKPYIWAQGVAHAFTVNLIEIEAEDGTVGIGETTTAPDAAAQALALARITRSFVGQSVFDAARQQAEAFHVHFIAFGGTMPRYANQLLSGIDMACLDLQGKILGRPVWDLLGGARRDRVGYFYFLQGETAEELAADAASAVAAGNPIIYLKVGFGPDKDVAVTKAVREAIGSARLRLDANEAWDPATALRMLAKLAPYDIEYVEQPTPSGSIEAMGQVTARSPIAIGADQSVFTLHDVYEVCRRRAADMITIGPREIGGLRPMIKAAAVAEAAGMKICIHSSMTTGISNCAEHHVARAIPNLDDGNQIIWELMRDNIVASPDLAPVRGELSLPWRPGLGIELDRDAVDAAVERFATTTAA